MANVGDPIDPFIASQSIISAATCVMFAIALIYDIYKHCNDEQSSEIQTHIVALIYGNLFVITTCIISGTLVLLFPTSGIMCNWVTRIWFLLFHLSRCILYLISLQRMVIMYRDTIIPFNINTHRYAVYALITIYAVVYLIIPLSTSYMGDFDFLSLQTVYNTDTGCVFHYESSFPLQYTSSIFHILMVIYLLHLFIHPLRKLVQIQCQSNNKRVTHQLDSVMVKYGVLHSLSIISAIVLMIFCVLFSFGYNYSVMDAFINGIILILLNSIHNRVYKYLCCILHPFIMSFICKSEASGLHKRNKDTELTEDDSGDMVGKGVGFQTDHDVDPDARDHNQVTVELATVEDRTSNLWSTDHDIIAFKSYQNSFVVGSVMTEEEFNNKQHKTLQFLDAFSCDL